MRDLDELTTITAGAIQLAHELLSVASPTGIRTKMDRDFVTDVDLQLERELRAHLAHHAPEIGFLGEEEGQTGPTDTYWILDPIDGTTNFIHGLPLYATSLALVHHGRTLTGAVNAPALNLRYTAASGHGAHCNGQRISASTTTDLAHAVVAIGDYATGPAAPAKNSRRLRLTAALAERVERLRMLGTAALDLAFVADGRIDAAVTLANKPWDTAAGALLVREAQAVMSDLHGLDHSLASTATVAVSPGVRTELHEVLRQAERLDGRVGL